jgi:hypothetical protein
MDAAMLDGFAAINNLTAIRPQSDHKQTQWPNHQWFRFRQSLVKKNNDEEPRTETQESEAKTKGKIKGKSGF